MSRARTTMLAVLAAAAGATTIAAPAGAHGGFQIMAQTSGPYAVVVRARPYHERGVSKIDVTSYVVRQDIGEPDLGAAVTLRLAGPDETRTVTPKVVGDGYEAIVDAESDAWRTWTVTARVTGAAGTATVTGRPVGEESGPPVWLVPASLVLVAGAAATALALRRRRGPPPDDDWDAVPT